MAEATYFGNPGLIRNPGGELITDRKGLVTGQVSYKVRPGRWADMPVVGSVHPDASFCVMERRKVRMDPGFWVVLGDYVGCEVEKTEPVYDFNPGVGTEPLEITKNFVTEIAGKPSAPLNGAIFLDEEGNLTTDDTKGVFERFKALKADGTANPWAGTENFLTLNNGIYTKAWVSRAKPTGIAGSEKPLKIVTELPGPQPTFGGNYNWLEFPPAYSSRGGVFENRQSWLLSGPKGFNTVIYNE
jgi:hypothetical protein